MILQARSSEMALYSSINKSASKMKGLVVGTCLGHSSSPLLPAAGRDYRVLAPLKCSDKEIWFGESLKAAPPVV